MTKQTLDYSAKCLNQFKPLITTKKRLKILVGGRGSTKTTFVADKVLFSLMLGEIWCCAREFQNSISESVYRTLCDEIERLKLPGFSTTATTINHESGGYAFFIGIARNISSIKGQLSGVRGLWVEEAESISDNTLRVLSASLRNSAKDVQDMIDQGIDISDMPTPEIWCTLNRGSRGDPISKAWLSRCDDTIMQGKVYQDDFMMAVQVDYKMLPQSWWMSSGLETERAADEMNMTPAQYRHKWHGDYLDTVENAIIQPEWFDACVDAHIKLNFEALGQERCAYDPSDQGDDAAAWGWMHGSIVKDVKELKASNVVEKTALAILETNRVRPDIFTWDADGLGAGLTYQISEGFTGKKIKYEQFKGSLSPDKPNAIYQKVGMDGQKSNKETFLNWRSQFYTMLADKMLRTYLAVKKGAKVYNPDDLISFSSDITQLTKLKTELCRIPLKDGGRIQILSKPDMKSKGIDSPNLADVVMMMQRHIDDTVYVEEETTYFGGGFFG